MLGSINVRVGGDGPPGRRLAVTAAADGFDAYRTELLRLRGRRRVALVALPSVPSTNLLGRRIAGDYLGEEMTPPPVVLAAWEQTAGRGRHGRCWWSPAGRGVWASLVRPIERSDEMAALPLLAAVGLAGALDRRLPPGTPCRLKWPNDLMAGGRKLGGILIEGVSRRGETAAVIGFGINCRIDGAEPPAGGVAGPTSLETEGGECPELAELTWELIDALDAQLDRLGDAERAVRLYAERSIHAPGDRLRCVVGEEIVEGTFQGFDRRGFLRLGVDGGERLLAAGELVAPEAAEVGRTEQ
jgi:BirA family biotin operon repressor/biotin-[acetyl-CoA-carboxylase] ligase